MSRSDWLGPVLIGAAVGAGLGYLYLTDDGRRVRRNVEPWLDEFSLEMRRIRRIVMKARSAMDEGRQSAAAVWDLAAQPGQVGPAEDDSSRFI